MRLLIAYLKHPEEYPEVAIGIVAIAALIVILLISGIVK